MDDGNIDPRNWSMDQAPLRPRSRLALFITAALYGSAIFIAVAALAIAVAVSTHPAQQGPCDRQSPNDFLECFVALHPPGARFEAAADYLVKNGFDRFDNRENKALFKYEGSALFAFNGQSYSINISRDESGLISRVWSHSPQLDYRYPLKTDQKKWK